MKKTIVAVALAATTLAGTANASVCDLAKGSTIGKGVAVGTVAGVALAATRGIDFIFPGAGTVAAIVIGVDAVGKAVCDIPQNVDDDVLGVVSSVELTTEAPLGS